jgi:hypothetical protein
MLSTSVLIVDSNDSIWRVSGVATDNGLSANTLLRPVSTTLTVYVPGSSEGMVKVVAGNAPKESVETEGTNISPDSQWTPSRSLSIHILTVLLILKLMPETVIVSPGKPKLGVSVIVALGTKNASSSL